MDKTQATKRISIKPWHLEGDKIVDASGYYITQGSLHGKSEKSRDNDMAYIVHCVNTHDELVEALKALLFAGTQSNRQFAEQSLLKAGEA